MGEGLGIGQSIINQIINRWDGYGRGIRRGSGLGLECWLGLGGERDFRGEWDGYEDWDGN